MDRNQGRPRHEANLPAEQHQAQTHAWISSSDGNQERASSSAATAVEGQSSTGPVTPLSPSRTLLRRPAGFSRLKRLSSAAQFGQVFAQPKRSSDRYFTVLSRRNEISTARLGLAVSRRVARLAVDRNRLKRLAREVFRCQQNLPPLDFVVMANKAAPAAENSVLRDSLQRHFDGISKRAN